MAPFLPTLLAILFSVAAGTYKALDELFWIYEPENKTYFQFYQNK
jgi:hypothetical protein